MSDTFDLKIKVSTPKSTGGEAEETRGSLHFDDKELEKFSIMSGETRTIEAKVEVEDGDHQISVKHLFSASPSSALIVDQIEMDDAGYIIRTKGAQTNVSGVFVAGDCSDKVYRQAVTAAGMGCAAAIEAERLLASENQ